MPDVSVVGVAIVFQPVNLVLPTGPVSPVLAAAVTCSPTMYLALSVGAVLPPPPHAQGSLARRGEPGCPRNLSIRFRGLALSGIIPEKTRAPGGALVHCINSLHQLGPFGIESYKSRSASV